MDWAYKREMRFVGIKNGGLGPAAYFEAKRNPLPNDIRFYFTRTLKERIIARKKLGLDIKEEERALEALDKYQEVSN